MDKVRERKLEARAHRLECLKPTVEKTIHVPQPKNLVKKEPVIVKPKSPEVTGTVKRGRGRPPKMVTEKINTKKTLSGNKKPGRVKGKK